MKNTVAHQFAEIISIITTIPASKIIGKPQRIIVQKSVNFSVLYQQTQLDEKGRVFLDPNTLSEDGTTAVNQTAWTEDGQILAYGISEKGSDWTTVKV
jgi:prolyl oligopeptidase PreP (S9A serine peptidase family)